METWRQNAYLETIEWAGRTWIGEPGRLNAGDKLLTSLSSSDLKKKQANFPRNGFTVRTFQKVYLFLVSVDVCFVCLCVYTPHVCQAFSGAENLPRVSWSTSVGDGN